MPKSVFVLWGRARGFGGAAVGLELCCRSRNTFRPIHVIAGFARNRNENGQQETGGERAAADGYRHPALRVGNDRHAGIAGAASEDASAAVCAGAPGGDCSNATAFLVDEDRFRPGGINYRQKCSAETLKKGRLRLPANFQCLPAEAWQGRPDVVSCHSDVLFCRLTRAASMGTMRAISVT